MCSTSTNPAARTRGTEALNEDKFTCRSQGTEALNEEKTTRRSWQRREKRAQFFFEHRTVGDVLNEHKSSFSVRGREALNEDKLVLPSQGWGHAQRAQIPPV